MLSYLFNFFRRPDSHPMFDHDVDDVGSLSEVQTTQLSVLERWRGPVYISDEGIDQDLLDLVLDESDYF